MYVCLCNAVTDTQITDALDNGASSMREVSSELGVGRNCGQCCKAARQIIKQHKKDNSLLANLGYAAA